MRRPNTGTETGHLAALREKIASATGKRYWRSLEELADTPDFQKFLEDEFPSRSEEWLQPASRRDILRFMGASFALAGLAGCTRQPTEKIVPYVKAPEDLVPGKAMYYATAMPFMGSAVGLLVESHMGRPTKVEGNPQHPENRGTTNIWAQASPLGLYDPDRSQTVVNRSRQASWDHFLRAMIAVREKAAANQGRGLHVLTAPVSSPSLGALMKSVKAAYPAMQWHQYEPVSRHGAMAGAQAAFGSPVNTIYRFDKADVVLSLDSDFLYSAAGHLRYAADFISRRKTDQGTVKNRLYVVEPTPSVTGVVADHRMAMRSADIEPFARAVAAQMGMPGGAQASGEAAKWAAAVGKDLQAHKGTSVVIAGDQQSPALHALAHAMNAALGNVGQTVFYTDPLEMEPVDSVASLRALTDAMNAGQVEALLILDCNPVYDAPADLGFAEKLIKVAWKGHAGLYHDETAVFCDWHVPLTHFLETWGDVRAYDGSIALQQPLIAPLYDNHSPHQILSTLVDAVELDTYQYVKSYWQGQSLKTEDAWQTAVHDGLVPDTALPTRAAAGTGNGATPPATDVASGLEIVFRPDPSVWDGRFANNGWLQELPKPYTKLTWDNAVLVSPSLADRMKLANEDVVTLKYKGREVVGPVWIVPGQAADSVTVFLGYGRTRAGRVGDGAGFDAYALRTADQPWGGVGLEIVKTSDKLPLACTQHQHNIDGRDVVRVATNEQFEKNEKIFEDEKQAEAKAFSLMPPWKYNGYAWGMAIDLNACIGCNACVVACQSENNIPVVGKDQVGRGRAMHWIRIDRYHEGRVDAPSTHFQPLACVHCEQAPCELVCPVAATIHSGDGLNQMVYNRCVGTRYCSNNCPYKVRRFNFYLYQDWTTPSLAPLRNPDVTVRSRGVMEKCTYCTQRIQEAKIETEKQDRRIRDGEVVTACQSACPTGAIIFGDINDANSRVYKLKQSPRNYSLLGELGTMPRTTYLAKLRNPNPEMENA